MGIFFGLFIFIFIAIILIFIFSFVHHAKNAQTKNDQNNYHFPRQEAHKIFHINECRGCGYHFKSHENDCPYCGKAFHGKR